MKETVASDADIDKGSLDSGLDVNHPPLIDITEVFLFSSAFVVELVKAAIFENSYTDLLALDGIHQDLPDCVRLLAGNLLAGRRFSSS